MRSAAPTGYAAVMVCTREIYAASGFARDTVHAAEGAELAGFQSAVRLLCDASSALAAEPWRDRHGAAAEALKLGVD
eukprot:scaffold50086_cov65-Phaeocystis_antarctica.AAC.2